MKFKVTTRNTYETEATSLEDAINKVEFQKLDVVHTSTDIGAVIVRDRQAETMAAVQQVLELLTPLINGSESPDPEA